MDSLQPSGLVDVFKFYIDDYIINKPRLLVTYINFSIQDLILEILTKAEQLLC